MPSHRAQGLGPASDDQAVLGDEPRRHVAGQPPATVRPPGHKPPARRLPAGARPGRLLVLDDFQSHGASLRRRDAGLADDDNLLRTGREQPVAKVVDLSAVDARRPRLAWSCRRPLGWPPRRRRPGAGIVEPAPVRDHLVHDGRHVLGRGLEQAGLQSAGPLPAVALARPVPAARAGDEKEHSAMRSGGRPAAS